MIADVESHQLAVLLDKDGRDLRVPKLRTEMGNPVIEHVGEALEQGRRQEWSLSSGASTGLRRVRSASHSQFSRDVVSILVILLGFHCGEMPYSGTHVAG